MLQASLELPPMAARMTLYVPRTAGNWILGIVATITEKYGDFLIRCDATKVDCSHRGLEDIPSGIPTTTTHLVLSDNSISKISALGLFNRLPNLQILDMSRNKIEEIEQGAFEGAYSINEM